MNANQIQLVRTARITGFWYLMLAVTGMLGFLVFHSKIYVSSDPQKTLTNLIEQESLSRVRLLFELLIVLSQALAALWFYKLFRTISEWRAWAIGIWGSVNAIFIMISGVAMAAAIQIASSSVESYENKILLVDLLGQLIRHSWKMGGLFFGLWLIPMGHIIVTSRLMPLWLGRTLILGGAGYILSTLISYMGYQNPLLNVLTIPATIGEFWMIGYLLIYGIRPLTDNVQAE